MIPVIGTLTSLEILICKPFKKHTGWYFNFSSKSIFKAAWCVMMPRFPLFCHCQMLDLTQRDHQIIIRSEKSSDYPNGRVIPSVGTSKWEGMSLNHLSRDTLEVILRVFQSHIISILICHQGSRPKTFLRSLTFDLVQFGQWMNIWIEPPKKFLRAFSNLGNL